MLKPHSESVIDDRIRELEKEVVHLREKEAVLIESEKRLRHLFDGARDAIFITDTKANVVDVNDGATSLTGYSKQELNGMSIKDLHAGEDLTALINIFDMITKGEAVTFEMIIRRKDGSHVDIECSNRRILVQEVP